MCSNLLYFTNPLSTLFYLSAYLELPNPGLFDLTRHLDANSVVPFAAVSLLGAQCHTPVKPCYCFDKCVMWVMLSL